ncbi:MAG TPA: hypothetical protein VJL37_11520 [Flavobacterium sp.]|nr:hypothetical protein [Flavobacterium sp.]
MSEIINNTQAQKATTSNQGTNKVPKLDAKSFFFLEDEVFTQQVNNAFGVVSENEFRTTSLVTISAKKIVSICSGQVFLQPNSVDANKVNLILKPYKQPVAGLSIKYFIYRGLPKNQFLDSSNKVLATGSGLITHIRTEFNNFYQQDASLSSAQPELLGKYIGYPDSAAPTNQAQVGTDLIDEYFYKISQTFEGETGDITNAKRAFEMPMIPAGTELTTAISGEIGLDIVLNYGDYYIENDPNPFKLDLNFARAPHNVINVSGITDAYQKKLMRENIIQFIDPAAFYGLHANGGKVLKLGSATAIETPVDIYTLINSFVTKNNIYIYVQSNRQRSYNFYNKYGVSATNSNNIKIGTTEANLLETTFETSKWPVKIFSTVPASGSDKQTIALQFTTDKSSSTSLYGQTVNLLSANSENFMDAKDLVREPDSNGVVSDFTKTIILSSPISSNANIASIVQLIYLGKRIVLTRDGEDDGDPLTPIPTVEFTSKYMDDVFYLIEATSFLKADKIYHVHSYMPTLYNQTEIDKNRNRVVSFTQRTQNAIAINETENLTLFTYLSIVESEQSNHSNFSANASPNKEATGYGVQNLLKIHSLPNLPTDEYIDLKIIKDNKRTVTGIILKSQNSNPTTIALGLTEQQNNTIKLLLTDKLNPRLYFDSLNSFEEQNPHPKITSKKYRLGIIYDLPTFIQDIVYPQQADEIVVYTLDSLVFFTKEYSDYIELVQSKLEFELYKTDSIKY